jgi:hypothetical protein
MAGLVPIGAKFGCLNNAFSVMPGLVPGSTPRRGAAFQNSNLLGCNRRRQILGLALRVATWVTGTSLVMKDRAADKPTERLN